MIPEVPLAGKPAKFAYSRTSSTKDGSCADGTLPVASSGATPFAAPIRDEETASVIP